MSKSGADVAALRALAQSLEDEARELAGTRTGIRARLGSVYWQGPIADRFRSDWRGHLDPLLARTVTSLESTGALLRRNAEAQERTSGAGGGTNAHLGPVGSGKGSPWHVPGSQTPGGGFVGGTVPGAPVDQDAGPRIPELLPVPDGATYDPATGIKTRPVTGEAEYTSEHKTEDGVTTSTEASKATVGAEHGFEKGTPGTDGHRTLDLGASFSSGTSDVRTAGEITKDGWTTSTSTSDISVSRDGSISLNKVGAGAGETTGETASYSVRVPEGARTEGVTPFDPTSIPVGGSVVMESGDYTTSSLSGSFDKIAAESKITTDRGVSSTVERLDENSVRITSGPTGSHEEVLDLRASTAGVSSGITGTSLLEGTRLRIADLDVSTPEGAAAYQRYLVSGELPDQPSPGISGVTSVERLDFQGRSTIDWISTDFWSASSDVVDSKGSDVLTRFPDGSSEAVTTFGTSERPVFTTKAAFEPDGTEKVFARETTYTVVADDVAVRVLNDESFGFDPGEKVAVGDRVELSLNDRQMRMLLSNSVDAVQNAPGGPGLSFAALDQHGRPVTDHQQFANTIGSGFYRDGDFLQMISHANTSSEGRYLPEGPRDFPGRVTVVG
ncbi:WXG100 family type VII secretion target [Oerskovia jenensis]|uniref:WXG100 family type VII secretion target n=1 Tax=Oerskovia jenensis TaxID=162169 RepID=UPI0036D8BC51